MEKVFLEAFEQLIELIDKNWDDINISAGIWNNGAWDLPGGSKTAFEIGYFSEGDAVIKLNNNEHKVNTGSIYFSDYMFQTSCTGGKFKLYFVTIHTKNMDLYKNLRTCFYVLSGYVPESAIALDEYFIKLFTETQVKKPYSSYISKNCILDILIHFYRQHSLTSSEHMRVPKPKHQDIVKNILAYFDEHYNEGIKLKELSKNYALSMRYLNRIFEKATGNTIINHLIKVRIEKAKRLLLLTDNSITNIALDVGFYDCQHFCNSFKSSQGMTPSEYRTSFSSGINSLPGH